MWEDLNKYFVTLILDFLLGLPPNVIKCHMLPPPPYPHYTNCTLLHFNAPPFISYYSKPAKFYMAQRISFMFSGSLQTRKSLLVKTVFHMKQNSFNGVNFSESSTLSVKDSLCKIRKCP